MLVAAPVAWRMMSASKMTASSGDSNGSDHPLLNKPAPELAEGFWLNSSHHTIGDFKNNVVLLEFWTYGCYNCRNTLPSLKGWNKKFAGKDFTIIGVHTPEFDAEKDIDNVREHVRKFGISYPVVTDNDYKTWDAYHQEYWPVIYLIDRKGIIRYVSIGEGRYEETEEMITSLLAEQ